MEKARGKHRLLCVLIAFALIAGLWCDMPLFAGRARAVTQAVEQYYLQAEGDNIESVFSVLGFSFAGQGQNMGMMFVKLKDWSERTA